MEKFFEKDEYKKFNNSSCLPYSDEMVFKIYIFKSYTIDTMEV